MTKIFALLLSYVAAAPVTEKISMDVSQTEWANIWTYVIWIFGVPIWLVIIALLTAVAVAVVEKFWS